MLQTIYYDLRDIKGQQKEIRDKINAAAKILREVTPEQIADNLWNADHYIELAQKHKQL